MNNTITKQLPNQREGKLAKTDSRYWLSRIFKPVNDRGEASPHYAMQLMFKGRRMAFGLRTANGEAAARRARDIYGNLLALGVEATLAKHRTKKPEKPEGAATIGEWVTAAKPAFGGESATFGGYARCLRSIAADILSVAKSKKRFAPGKSEGYRRKIDAASLAVLSETAVHEWRIRFVARAGAAPDKKRTARISCNSMIRQARALFSPKILKHIAGVAVPTPLPFAGCEMWKREDMRYRSRINPASLLQKARDELAESDPEIFKALLLAIGAGMRRKEIDSLLWRQVDFDAGIIHIEVTEAGRLKSEDSAGDVSIDESFSALLRGYYAKASGLHVIEGGEAEAGSRSWGQRYRCDDAFARLNSWLRANGVDNAKPLHTLRKEAGSIVATASGIYAASRFLRHADIQVTAMHYADHKERVTVGIAGFLRPENVTEMKPVNGNAAVTRETKYGKK